MPGMTNSSRWPAVPTSPFCLDRLLFAGTIQVAGLDEPTGRSFRKGGPDLEKALAGYDPGRLTILLSHRPDGFDRAVRKKVDLQLSEHSHAGQIPPMDLFTWLTYAYPFGYFEKSPSYAILCNALKSDFLLITISYAF